MFRFLTIFIVTFSIFSLKIVSLAQNGKNITKINKIIKIF